MAWQKEEDLLRGTSGMTGPTERHGISGYSGYTKWDEQEAKLDAIEEGSRWAQLHKLEPSGLIFVDPTKSPYPVLRLDREEVKPLNQKEIHDIKQNLVNDLLEAREKLLFEQHLEKTKTANAAMQYQKFVDLILNVPALAPSTKDKISAGKTVGFRCASYMRRNERLEAVEAISKEFGVDWIFKALFVLRSEDYPIKNWKINERYACTLLDDYTVLLYKIPEPNSLPKKKEEPKPEPAPYWKEEDIVGYHKVTAKEKIITWIKANPRSFIFSLINTVGFAVGGFWPIFTTTAGWAISHYIDRYDRKP